MTARIRLWRQRVKHHPVATVLISLSALLVVLVLLGGYQLNWGWTGFNGSSKSGKTLWDWMQLLFMPVVLAVAGFLVQSQGVNLILGCRSFYNSMS